jgi:hypothetical protein
VSQWRRVVNHKLSRWALALAGYASVVSVALIVTATSVDRLVTTWLKQDAAQAPARPTTQHAAVPSRALETVVIRSAAMIPTNDEWADKLRDPSYWNKLKSGKSSSNSSNWSKPAAKLGGPVAAPAAVVVVPRGKSKTIEVKDKDDDGDSSDDTYRTVCVRLCDGAFFPLSFSTTRENFDADAARCDKTCAGSRMFFYKNPGETLDDMEDLKGQPYKKLPTAFLYRTTYDAGCKCRAHPWEEASRTQHRVYALEAQKAKGDKAAALELTDLKTKMAKAERDAAAEKKRAELEKIAAQKKLADDAKAAKAKGRQTAQADRDAGRAKRDTATEPTAQIKASAQPAGGTPSTANLWGPKVGGAPMSRPINASFTPVPDAARLRSGLGAR